MSGNVTQLRTRRPTCKVAWPLILLAGDSKTGKSYRAAQLTGDERVGRAFWLDLGEGCADEYGAVPGADYDIVDHDGTWVDIIAQVEAVRDFARAELEAKHKPVVLVIDSMTAEWAMLTEWTNERAKRSRKNQALLSSDPDAEIDVTSNYWNDANSRHNRLMNILKTFPGIVVMTTLETEKTQFGPSGQPVSGAPKVAKPDGQKRLPADATVWIRLSLTEEPVVVGIRSLKRNITPGKDRPQPWPDFTLAGLVFDFLGIESATTEVRVAPVLNADQVAPGEEPQPTEPVDRPRAEATPIRQTREPRPSKLTKAEAAEKGTSALLAASTEEAANKLVKVAAESIARQVDVAGSLVEARDELKVQKGDKVTLEELAALVLAYVIDNGYSVSEGIKLAKAEEADRPSDHSGGTEHLFGQEGAA